MNQDSLYNYDIIIDDFKSGESIEFNYSIIDNEGNNLKLGSYESLNNNAKNFISNFKIEIKNITSIYIDGATLINV
jgi:hypothetical protein